MNLSESGWERSGGPDVAGLAQNVVVEAANNVVCTFGEFEMATYTWEFGSAAAGLQFSVVYDDSTGKFTVRVQEGALNVNALWFSNGDMTSDGNTTLTKRDNNLNMNGSNTVWNDDGTPSSEKIVWDSYLPVSSPGLTSTPPDSYIVAGSAHDSFEICAPVGFNPAGITLGVRATSTTTAEGSIKWVDKTAAYDDGADPWGDNPFVILPEDSAIGDPGGPGDNGDPGADGTDVTVDGANGANGANGSNGSTTGAPVAPTPGIAGQPGANGDTGGNGGNGENGGPGGDGGLVIPVPQDAAFTAILINASDGAVEIRGGDGGAGGNGGDGGPGGDGGDGGDGGKGGNGGNGAATGNTASRSGAAGGAGGNGGSGGDGGDGGNGGNGGDGGDGGNAIENGVVNDVYIIGSNNVTILGGAGGAGGLGGAAGGGGTAGDGGDGGLGGAGGTGTAPSGVNGASGTPGGTGSDGTDGTAGVAGANGQDGADAAAFSDAVNVYANLMGPNEFTGFLTISGSNYNDTMFMGSVGSMIYATTGNDAYTFGAGPDTIVFTSAAQSNGTTSTDTIFSWGSTDVINVSALFGGTLSFVGDTTITPLTANSLGWYESGGDTHVVADVTGDGSADLHLILNGTSLGLTASDFVL